MRNMEEDAPCSPPSSTTERPNDRVLFTSSSVQSPPLPLRRALLRERQRPLHEVLASIERGDRRGAVLALDRRFQAGLVQALVDRLLRCADRHGPELAD